MLKKTNIKKRVNLASPKTFWDKEYLEVGEDMHFKLSEDPGSDFLKFVKWIEKTDGVGAFNNKSFFIDSGCGNGRHAIYLTETYKAAGMGYDISAAAIEQANARISKNKDNANRLKFTVQNINKSIPAESDSADYVIDAMASHVLREAERKYFKEECLRVLRSGGYIFLKTLLRDGDFHSKDMIKNNPGGEANSYIHPKIGIFEHSASEAELVEFYSKDFDIEKIEKSFIGNASGKTGKRRYIVMYLRKK